MKNKIGRKKRHPLFAVVKWVLKLFYRRHAVIGAENVMPGPSVFVCNHAKSYAPLVMSFYFPYPFRPWVMSTVFDRKLCADYLEGDFITQELKLRRPFSRWLARIIAPLCIWVMDVTGAIPVYKGQKRIIETFSMSVSALEQGDAIVLFPEDPVKKHSEYIDDFQRGFVHLARFYHNKTGGQLSFYPVYIDKAEKQIVIGRPIGLLQKESFSAEKESIRLYLRDSVNALAERGSVR